MSKSNRDIMSNSILVWCIIIIIPVASFGLYVYEVFFKENNTTVVDQSRSAASLYEEARLLEVNGDIIKAYAYYQTIVEIHKDSSISSSAEKRIDEIKETLKQQIDDFAQNQKWSELKKAENIITVILPERTSWLKDVLAAKKNNAVSREDTNKTKDENQDLLDALRITIDNYLSQGKIDEAFHEANNIVQNKNKSFKEKAEKIVAKIHYEFAITKYESIKKSMSGVDISILKHDFNREIQDIKKHLKIFIKTADKNNMDVENAKNLLEELK